MGPSPRKTGHEEDHSAMSNSGKESWYIRLSGLVQGVGFRPFVRRLAVSRNIQGWVRNSLAGVEIRAVGDVETLADFVHQVITCPPPGAIILDHSVAKESIGDCEADGPGEPYFSVLASVNAGADRVTLVPPDCATCGDCLSELQDKNNRRGGHPFISCAWCGPRYSITSELPYDRESTTMSSFPMCIRCSEEYRSITDRRFHAQTVACPDCGPTASYLHTDGPKEGELVESNVTALDAARGALKSGKLLAVKGIGGFHLVCRADSKEAICRIRRLKRRPDKPLAVMFKNFHELSQHCECTGLDRELLRSSAAPIVILQKKEESNLPREIAPQLSTIGALLPYSPVHHLLFEDGVDSLIVTSANESLEPIYFDDKEMISGIAPHVDGILLNNRRIANPLDDSVVTSMPAAARRWAPVGGTKGDSCLIRRSRGYAPLPVPLPFSLPKPILGCGSDQKACFCLGRDEFAFPAPYVGDLVGAKVLERYRYVLDCYQNLLRLRPSVVAYDLNPEYISSRVIAMDDWSHLPSMGVQHHHAHIAACMAENSVNEPVIGVAYDGSGYGADGTVWGGEFLLCTPGRFERLGHWQAVELPGNERAITQPWRMALSHLRAANIFTVPFGWESQPFFRDALELIELWEKVKSQWIPTSSMGRLFDGVAAILGLVFEATYDGQPAVVLEDRAWQAVRRKGLDKIESYTLPAFDGGIIPGSWLIHDIMEDLSVGLDAAEIAARFHRTTALATASLAFSLCEQRGIRKVVLSGGVWQNRLLLFWTRQKLTDMGMEVFTHHLLAPNDENIGYGQIVVAGARMLGREVEGGE